MLADISGRFVNVSAAEVDREIADAQQRICDSLDIDLLAVWQLSDKAPVVLEATHFYSSQQGSQPPGLLKQVDFPWFIKQLQAGRIVAVSSLEEMPAEAAHDREVCRQLGVKSNLSIPLTIGGGPLIGVLGLNTTRKERDWPDALVNQLKLIGQIFTNALARKRFELSLRESEERLSVAADSADVGLWVLDWRTRFFWASQKAREIFGYSADQLISMELFEGSVHPDDWHLVQGSIERALQAGQPLNVEYRLQLGDNQTRWIASRGRPDFTPTGEPERIMGVSMDITPRKLIAETLEERVHFETLLAELSARFVNLPADRIDSTIEDAQRRICELLDIDRSTLWQVSEGDPGTLLLTNLHQPQDILTPPEKMNARDFFPWTSQKVTGRGDSRYFENDRPPARSRPRPGELPRIQQQVRSVRSVINGRRAGIRSLGIRSRPGREKLARDSRDGVQTDHTGICQRPRTQTNGRSDSGGTFGKLKNSNNDSKERISICTRRSDSWLSIRTSWGEALR